MKRISRIRTRHPSIANNVVVPDMTERLGSFQSLGGNCEFGFVQRACGAESSGLLRFNFTPLDDLIRALETNFDSYGSSGDLRIEKTETDYYYCASRSYNFWMNTAHAVGDIDPEVLLVKEYGRIAHLKNKFLLELAAGSKILVRKVGPGESESDFDRLAQAIWRHGPSTLLRVTEEGSDWICKPVRSVAPLILEGSVRRFAPLEKAWDIDIEPWARLCDSAYAARHQVPESALYADHFQQLKFSTKLRYHRGRHSGHQLSAFTKAVSPSDFDSEAVYVFSAWVWIPEGCAASRIFSVSGREPLMGMEANMDVRNCWQRIWSAGKMNPSYEKVPVGIGLIGGRSDEFWSCGSQFHKGRIPYPAIPPAAHIRPSLVRRISRLWM
ncbi:hypothetical protein [Methylobacterium sp. WL8]|uniref:hypothetical protein n=1 Tax=Methylobacterium sp. WL8 TaxID=2603899 RepID=UPI0011C92911|nr:hypothetical protein [Methylobacterium sp. WL8]TXN78285.1 hypothetical protein FV234_22995 [Methylobacterium sp. WL8]